jgi:hypothetical protein
MAMKIHFGGEEGYDILPRITDKMQRYTIFFIAVSAVHVSGGFSAHDQEPKIQNCTHTLTHASGSSKQA